MPVSALVHQIVVNLIGNGLGELDFASLLELEARGANFKLVPDPREVADGLSSPLSGEDSA
jgi:3-hydroxyisobutyrate dehydrogenase